MASMVVSKTIDIGSNPILPVYVLNNIYIHYRSD